jgi:hypothetical protein
MSGRQRTQIVEQAARYGIPFGGKTIDLPAVVAALHNFLAANAAKLGAADGPQLDGPDSSQLERYRRLRADKLELEVQELAGELVRGRVMAEGMGAGFVAMRHAIESLQRRYGPDAGDLMCDAIDSAERATLAVLGKYEDEDPPARGAGQNDPAWRTTAAIPANTQAQTE